MPMCTKQLLDERYLLPTFSTVQRTVNQIRAITEVVKGLNDFVSPLFTA